MLGLCCHWLDKNNKNLLPSKRLQLGRFNDGKYTEKRIRSTYIDNLTTFKDILPKIHASGIRVFRMSSAMFSLYDKVPSDYWDNEVVNGLLEDIGKFILSHNMRLTTHPDQFVVLSSDNPTTVENAIRELEFHAWVFDQMKLPRIPYYAINVHAGGKPTQARFNSLLESIGKLSSSAKSRLTLENCEFGWSVKNLVKVSETTHVPVVFDSHHHSFNPGGLTGAEAMTEAAKTWPISSVPLTHLSNSPESVSSTASATKRRAHSQFIYEIPEYQKNANNLGHIDIDVEAKMKNHAITDMVAKLGVKL